MLALILSTWDIYCLASFETWLQVMNKVIAYAIITAGKTRLHWQNKVSQRNQTSPFFILHFSHVCKTI